MATVWGILPQADDAVLLVVTLQMESTLATQCSSILVELVVVDGDGAPGVI
eukprot:CAMPEP_0177659636 /NCGR_PEP_ID=MMETSP0447-20121125/17558_1 /TAXON_ID=0 /ORGANISM="Stygamoeba regulata, Strain BSH-02190019" /LENGTH=50 /DNA_ID=CAMNT_0019164539 /DNA_START=214 /DNA_END=366 /DNA_ORIENTATION=+